MTDVIFNGSINRSAHGRASVELVFDNPHNRVPGEFGRFTEISVRREVLRDGSNHYQINGQKCRRKDVTDLFLGTGLGPRSYAIIEQGTVSRLVESRPADLKLFMEEAAGSPATGAAPGDRAAHPPYPGEPGTPWRHPRRTGLTPRAPQGPGRDRRALQTAQESQSRGPQRTDRLGTVGAGDASWRSQDRTGPD